MKARKNNICIILITILSLWISNEIIAQENINDLKDFNILITKTKEGIKMKSTEGTAWVDLAFSIQEGVPQAIDEYGMTDLDNTPTIKDNNIADFLFTITKTKKVIELKGIKGTAWTKLEFTINENQEQKINQFGMRN